MSERHNYGSSFYNLTLRKHLKREVISFLGRLSSFKKIQTDKKFPDGTPRKLLDSNKINQLGWKCKFTLDEGLNITYKDFIKTIEK